MVTNNYKTIKSEFLKHPSVLGVTASSNVPGRWLYHWRMWPTGMRDQKSQPLNFLNVDYDFLKIYDMEIIAGRAYDQTLGSDLEAPGWIINEEAVKAYDWDSPEDALGKEMMDDRTPIIGVVKNFHFKGLQNAVEPFGMSVWSDHFKCFTLKVDLSNLDETISFAEKTYRQFFPGEIFDYFFLDEDFNRHYQLEEKISKVFSIFTFLGIAIAILGLFGLSAFIAEQRTREIGVRKVFGASVVEVVYSLLKDFGKWILIATVIAWPVAWYVAKNWLQNFAYRTTLGIELFILSGLIALVIVLIATCYQIIKAATANPVDSLRYE
jgi:putative ABC transport system permease protein